MLDFQQGIGDPRGLLAITEISAQHLKLLPRRQIRVTPEQRLDLAPRKEVGVDNLVGVAAEQEVTGLFQGL